LWGAGRGFFSLAACESLALVTVLLIRWSDPRFLGGAGQAGLVFLVVTVGLAVTMLIAIAIGELLLIPLRLTAREA
jgi:hypothetical protein